MLQNEVYSLWPSRSLSPLYLPSSQRLAHTSHALQVRPHVSYFYIMAFSTPPLHRMDNPCRWETVNSEKSHTHTPLRTTMYDSRYLWCNIVVVVGATQAAASCINTTSTDMSTVHPAYFNILTVLSQTDH